MSTQETHRVLELKQRSSEPEAPQVLWTGTIFHGLLQYKRALLLDEEERYGKRDRRYKLYAKRISDRLYQEIQAIFEKLVRDKTVRPCSCIQFRTDWRDRLRYNPKCACGGSGFLPSENYQSSLQEV